MDYDNDGILDFLSGSYDPGDVYLFRGLGNGQYARVETILDEDEQALVHHPEEFAKYMEIKGEPGTDSDEATQMRVASFGSWAAPVDWDADGDLDILIGSFGGGVFLRENIGTREKPKYSRESVAVQASGVPLKEHSHANPVVADWDGDGFWDLVVGSGDGSVGWYKNVGRRSAPEFGSRNPLVEPAADEIFLEQNLKANEAPVPGARAQICVTDYNNDGRLDLIVGDYSHINWTKELTEAEQADFDQLKTQQKEVAKSLQKLQEVLYGEHPKEEVKAEKEAEYQEIIQKCMKLDEEKKSFFKESRSASFVWLYLRQGGAEAKTFVSAESPAAANSEESNDKALQPKKESSNSGPVAIAVELEPVGDGNVQRLSVTIDVQAQWHLYATASEETGYRTVEVNLNLPTGIAAVGDWQKPLGEPSLKNPATETYSGSITFTRDLEIGKRLSSEEIEVEISYQVCNESLCLPPKTVKKKIEISSD